MAETADPHFGETFVIQQETLDAILARRREGTTLSLRFVIYRSNLLSNQPDVSVAEFEWADVYSVPRGQTLRRRLEPRASESEFHRVVAAVARSQRVWRQQVADRIDAMSSFRAIDTDGNGLLDSDELARVAYVMDGGALMTPKEVKIAEAEIAAAGASVRDENALHAQPGAYAQCRVRVIDLISWCMRVCMCVCAARRCVQMVLKVSYITTGEVKGGIYTVWTLTSSFLGSQNDRPVNPSPMLIYLRYKSESPICSASDVALS
jgi:hypothetical protein